jgi:RNA polymerase sigma-70 factor (ECF subfamily)
MDGDRESWSRLMDRHAPRLAAYLGARLRRHDVVEKLVGEAVYAAWRHLPEYRNATDFGTWFRRLGAHLTMRWYSKNKGQPLAGGFPDSRCADDAEREDMDALETGLGKLPENLRMALEQRYRAGLEGEELAKVLHLADADAAEALVSEALAQLDAELPG